MNESNMSVLPTPYQKYIHTSRYSRWIDGAQRRETWDETVTRYFDYMVSRLKEKNNFDLDVATRTELQTAVLNLDIMPSMRLLMTAGTAVERCNVAAYNCAYVPIDSPRAFDEVLYILMNGTGVGFSVERECITKLPDVAEHFEDSTIVVKVKDSKSGWARAFKELISLLYSGQIPTWDMSLVRPAGARLKTFGGRASGPEPLNDLFRFAVNMFTKAAGRRLSSIECHDLVCKTAQVVVVGGVRRSALISLSNLSDDLLRSSKSGDWQHNHSYRSYANNSAVYKAVPNMNVFMKEWHSLYESRSGERGMFSRAAAKAQVAVNGRRDPEHEFGTNPCCEIILRPNQFCNLTEVVVKKNDTEKTIKKKVKLATILGTYQSTLTDFKYLRKIWADTTEEERLLGVSMTGIMDNELTNGGCGDLDGMLQRLRQVAVDTNKVWANSLGIPQSTAITCVKPSGTVSQLVDAASGIHPRHSKHYIRRVRGDKKDPLTQFLMDSGIPCEDAAGGVESKSTAVFSFPIEAPEGAMINDELTPIEHLELWLTYQKHWCEHKPSITITVREHEWLEVAAWVYKNFNFMSGVSFFPHSDAVYTQAPYEEVDEATYHDLLASMPKEIDFYKLQEYEKEDTTKGTQEFSCVGDVCELVDV
jgi:ribonucleoside-triphosphate reductase (thioredoxin)